FTIKLHHNLLEVDLKEGTKKKFEDFVEENPMLRGSLGFLFQNVIPLDVALKDIESVEQDDKGQVKITIPHRKDINIPLEPNESQRFIDKLKELILVEKQKEIERILALDRRKLLRRLKTLSLERGESEKIAHRPVV
ncbi:MAG: hypothetical protein JSV57_03625, partial [Candidatus Bathyarchaeota archaeon]